MKIAVLTSNGPGNGAISSAIARAHSDVRVFAEIHSNLESVRRVLRRRRDPWPLRFDRLAFLTWFAVRYGRALRRTIRATLGDDSLPARATRWAGSPDDALLATIRAYAPHVLVVLGASPLPPAWCTVAPTVVNVHTGWMPEYRGRFCWYWPVAEGDPRHVGITIHRLAEDLDAGEILWRTRLETLPPTLEELLTEVLVRARTGVLEFLEWVERDALPRGVPAEPLPPLRFEPGLGDHLRFVRRLRRAHASPVSR